MKRGKGVKSVSPIEKKSQYMLMEGAKKMFGEFPGEIKLAENIFFVKIMPAV